MIRILMSIAIMSIFCHALARIRDPFETSTNNPSPPVDPFFSFNENPTRITRMNMDDIVAAMSLPKKTEKLPFQKKATRIDKDMPIPDIITDDKMLFSQPGVAQKLTGSAIDWSIPTNFEHFQFGENEGDAVVNPAATFLNGGNFEKIPTPKCRLVACSGPFPNDGTLSVDTPSQSTRVCQRTFVPMNGCTNNKGYPMGMLCSICCECSADFISEMKKTVGFKIGYQT